MGTSQPYTLENSGSQTFLCYESSVKLVKNADPRFKVSEIIHDTIRFYLDSIPSDATVRSLQTIHYEILS